jgi:predicted PurR-regulated permease PerM
LGNTLMAAIEGIVGGLAFWLVGLPAALLWGTAMAVLAYLPLVGAALIWGPVAIYLLIQAQYVPATVLCVAGLVIVVLDYVVRTIVVGGASKLHTLLTFFGVLGGIQFFGLVGIVAGPLVVAVSLALLESYRAERAALVIGSSNL